MKRIKLFVPGLRDLMLAVYELIGNLVSRLLFGSRTQQKVGWGMVALTAIGVLSLSKRVPGALLVLALFPTVVILLRAMDIARMRHRLRRIAELPNLREPELPEELRERSPTIDALWSVARCLTLVRDGRPSSVEPTANGINRAILDRSTLRLLDASQALAAWELNDGKKAAALAASAVPVGIDAIDRSVARVLLAHAWQDDKRLASLRRSWKKRTGVLKELSLLIELRSKSTTDRVAMLEALDVALIGRLSSDARAIGDDSLADVLVPPARRVGAYR